MKRTADRRENLRWMTSTLKVEPALALVSGRSAFSVRSIPPTWPHRPNNHSRAVDYQPCMAMPRSRRHRSDVIGVWPPGVQRHRSNWARS